jgi:hypothetical protein
MMLRVPRSAVSCHSIACHSIACHSGACQSGAFHSDSQDLGCCTLNIPCKACGTGAGKARRVDAVNRQGGHAKAARDAQTRAGNLAACRSGTGTAGQARPAGAGAAAAASVGCLLGKVTALQPCVESGKAFKDSSRSACAAQHTGGGQRRQRSRLRCKETAATAFLPLYQPARRAAAHAGPLTPALEQTTCAVQVTAVPGCAHHCHRRLEVQEGCQKREKMGPKR